jgi:8-oxo-dGTP diphosphatase
MTAGRLRLRPLTVADAPALAEHCADWDVARMLRLLPHPYPPGLAEAYIETVRAADSPEQAWAIEVRGATVAGVVSLKRGADAEDAALTLGYWLGRVWWRQGIMTEAVTAVLDAAFAELPVETIEASVFTDNLASRRLLERLGFRFSAPRPVHNMARKAAVPYAPGRLTRADWRVNRLANRVGRRQESDDEIS